MRYCTHCAYAISDPAITICPRCGQPVESNAAWQAPYAESPHSHPPYGASPAWPHMLPANEALAPYQDYSSASVAPPGYAPPSMPFGGGMPPGAPFAPSTRPLYPQQPPGYGYGYGGYPGYREPGYADYEEPANPGYPGYPAYPGYGAPPAPAPKRGTAALIIVLVVTLLVVLVGGGVAIARLNNAQIDVSSPAPLDPASATATAAAAAGGILVYQNSFASDASGWSKSQHCFLGAGGYHVNSRACLAPIGNQADVDVTVQVKQISGQAIEPYGLAIRADGPLNDSPNLRYDFDIESNGKWFAARCDGVVNDANTILCTDLAHDTAHNAIHGGLNITNTLEVKAKGSHFDFYVNGVNVGGVDDSTYVSGRAGLECGPNAECVFTNLTVKALS